MIRLLIILSLSLCTFAFVTPFNQLEFTSWTGTGRRADSCHATEAATNLCATPTVNPESVTVLAPTPASATGTIAGTATRISGHFIRGTAPTVASAAVGELNSRVALSAPGAGCASIDATTIVTSSAQDSSLAFTIPASWVLTSFEFENSPRAVCFSSSAAGGFRFTGFFWKVVWSCDPNVPAQTCPPPSASTDAKFAGVAPAVLAAAAVYDTYPVNSTIRALRKALTLCCGTTSFAAQCVNPNVQSCCGGSAYSRSTSRCCSASTQVTVAYSAACPCFRSSADSDCLSQSETCCLPTKYPELAVDSNRDQLGQCYNSTTHACCDVGLRFDPGTQQCCVINGLQDLNTPCPCATDAECLGEYADKTDDPFHLCCQQSFPRAWESAFETRDSSSPTASSTSVVKTCDKYANYPTGSGDVAVQPCRGRCYDSRYLTCCNGVACVQSFEQCCNATCCPKFTGTCQRGRRPASGLGGRWNNRNDFGTEFQICTTVEQMNAYKAFWVFVMPTEMLAALFLGLSIALGFASHANHHNPRSYIFIERFMILLAILQVLFSVPYFFSPLYKYGSFQLLASLLVIIVAAARVRWLNFVSIFFQGLLLFYLFDPFHGSAYFNFASGRHASGVIDSETMGVLHVINKMWRSPRDPDYCTSWYDFFQLDDQTRDTDRFDNPLVKTFGYCSRAWIMALYLFTGFTFIFTLIQFITNLVAVIIRFRERYDVQLEVHKQ